MQAKPASVPSPIPFTLELRYLLRLGKRIREDFKMCVIARVLVVGFIFFVNPVVSHSGEIEFRDGDLFVGIANLGTSTRGNSHQLSRGFYSRNLVGVTSNSISLAESRSTLLFSPVGMTARMQFRTSANQQEFRSGWAQIQTRTSSNPNQFNWIFFRIVPNRSGEFIGKPVNVTLRASAVSTIFRRDNIAGNQYRVLGPQGDILNAIDRATQSSTRATSFNAKMGQWIPIAVGGISRSSRNSSASLQLTLDIDVR